MSFAALVCDYMHGKKKKKQKVYLAGIMAQAEF